jgi:hypothetical protein
MVRRAAVVGAVMVVVLAACGDDSSDDAETGDAEGAAEQAADAEGTASGDFCTDLESFVEEEIALMARLFDQDGEALRDQVDAMADSYPELAAAVEASAPPELADDVTTVVDITRDILDDLTDVDTSDPDAVEAALADGEVFGPEMGEAADRIGDYAIAECGFDPDDVAESVDDGRFADAAEPPDPCTFVDAQVAADAAGVTVDVADQDGGGSFNFPGYASRSCSYGNGSLSITTITFNSDPARAAADHVATAEQNDGTVLDADLGSLPADTTVVTEVQGMVSITVFEAPTAFTLSFSGVTDPAPLVAAAEAVLEATS